jgi:hypothetical protein
MSSARSAPIKPSGTRSARRAQDATARFDTSATATAPATGHGEIGSPMNRSTTTIASAWLAATAQRMRMSHLRLRRERAESFTDTTRVLCCQLHGADATAERARACDTLSPDPGPRGPLE